MTMLPPPLMKLGRLPKREDPRTFALGRYYAPSLPPPPASSNWAARGNAIWPMHANDRYGCCTVAAAAHMVEAWTASASKEVELTEKEVLAAYAAITGFDPKRPSTDNGAVMLDVLRHWRKKGIGGRRIGAFASVPPSNTTLVRSAVSLFGGLYLGLNLPLSAQRKGAWIAPKGTPKEDDVPGSWGGHAVNIVAYNARTLTCVTWGRLQRMTWDFLSIYGDEGSAIFSEDFLRPDGFAPSGFRKDVLLADLAAL